MKKRKGFTLIVILAIIAVIATPIIVGIIEDSRKAAFERSVEGIIHAIDIDFGTQESLETNEYTITDGKVNKSLKTPIKNIDGFNGKIVYDEKGNSTYAIYNDKWCMKKTSEGTTTTEYVAEECTLGESGGNSGAGQEVATGSGTPIYFDVVKGKGCTNYHEDNSLTGYNGITTTTDNQTSCLKFYAFLYNEGDAEVNLLLDHNTTAGVAWNSSGSNGEGPSTSDTELLGKLKADTASWVGTKTPENYKVEQIDESNSTTYGNYTIKYKDEGYKARLITAQEIAEITGADKEEGLMFDEKTSDTSNWFYFDTNTTSQVDDCKYRDTSGCEYGWLYDRTSIMCEDYGCLNNSDLVNTYGYWTSTSAFGYSLNAWRVVFVGTLGSPDVFYGDYGFGGVRPVITVSKSSL